MFNLFDILQTQSGGLQGFGQQFGLSPDQTRRAMEALLPALTISLQRNAAADPTGFGRLFGFFGPEAAKTGFAPPPTQADQLLGQLFGSPLVAQAVLQQASTASGVGSQALRQMLPVMAGMIVAGIVHLMLNQPQTHPVAAPSGPQPFAPAAAFWTDWINTVLPSSASPQGTAPAASQRTASTPRNPPPQRTASGADQPDAQPGPWHQLFQTGAEVQEQNVKAMREIFDAFWGSADSTTDTARSDEGSSRKPTGSRPADKP